MEVSVEAQVNTALQETTVRLMISGPCPKNLWALLETVPQPIAEGGKADRDEERKTAMASAAAAVQLAQQDVDAAKQGSTRLQEGTMAHLQECQAAMKAINDKQALNPMAVQGDHELSFAAVDRKRANAVTAFEQWQQKADKRTANALQETQIFIRAVEGTIATLSEQKSKMEDMQGSHAALWEAHQKGVADGHKARIQALEDLCTRRRPTNPFAAAAGVKDQSADAAVAQLQKALLEAQAMITAQQQKMADAAARYQEMQQQILELQLQTTHASSPEQAEAEDLGQMSEREQDARSAMRENHKEEQQGETEGGKGTGKGLTQY